MMILANFAD